MCRLRAGNEHGIVSPRLTQVNTTILEERDPYTKDGHAFESHDYVVYPGYPDTGTACDVPGDCADTCASLTIRILVRPVDSPHHGLHHQPSSLFAADVRKLIDVTWRL